MWTQIILGYVLTAALVVGADRVAERWWGKPAQAAETAVVQADGRYWTGMGHRCASAARGEGTLVPVGAAPIGPGWRHGTATSSVPCR